MAKEKTRRQSTKDYVENVILWYYESKKAFDNHKAGFEGVKYDFKNIMEQHFDRFAEDNKITIYTGDKYSGVKNLIVTKINPSKVIWNIKKLKSILDKKQRKVVIKKSYSVNNWNGLFELLKNSGVDFKEFMKYVSYEEYVVESALDKLIDLGLVDEGEVKECADIKFSTPSYRIKES